MAQKVLQAALGAVDLVAIYLGDRLGWYRSLAESGPASATELAERTGTPRGTPAVAPAAGGLGHPRRRRAAAADRRGRRGRRPAVPAPAASAEVLTDRDSLT